MRLFNVSAKAFKCFPKDTSGFRDLAELFLLAGWHQSDVAFSSRVEQLAYNQTELNFSPGTRFEYSNTGYFLLTQIVETITDQLFADWMNANVFGPLGMTSTRVQDQYGRLIQGRVSSYQQIDGVFSRSPLTSEEVGATGVHSTIEDLAKWMIHLLEGKIGGKNVYELMSRTGRLLDGTDVGYGFGLSVNEFSGQRRISHGGRTSGILGNVAIFPDSNLGVAVLSNVYPSEPLLDPTSLSMQIIEPLLPAKEAEQAVELEPPSTIPLHVDAAERVSGWYWSEDSNYLRRIYVRDDTLRYYRNPSSESALVPTGNDVYRMLSTQSIIEVSFLPKGEKAKTMTFRANNGPISTSYSSDGPFSPTDEQLSEYEGHYYSKELQTGYLIRKVGNTLTVFHPSRRPLQLQPIIIDHFKGGAPWWFGYDTTFVRDNEGNVTGFHVQNFHIKNVRFERL